MTADSIAKFLAITFTACFVVEYAIDWICVAIRSTTRFD